MKNYETVAIDIVLLLPNEINELCIELNNEFVSDTYVSFKGGHFAPHISLFHGYIKKSEIEHLISNIQPIIKLLAEYPISLKIDSLIHNKNTGLIFLEIENSASKPSVLNELQHIIHTMVYKYLPTDGFEPDGSCFADNNSNEIDWNFVANFSKKCSLENYWPHITLALNREVTKLTVSANPFFVNELALFWLSTHCTCNYQHRWA